MPGERPRWRACRTVVADDRIGQLAGWPLRTAEARGDGKYCADPVMEGPNKLGSAHRSRLASSALNRLGHPRLVTCECRHQGVRQLGVERGPMTLEPMTLGTLASGILGMLGLIGWRFRRIHLRTSGLGVFGLAEIYVRSQADAIRERERRTTILTTVAALPPGTTVVDRRADGATLTIRIPATLTPSQERSPWSRGVPSSDAVGQRSVSPAARGTDCTTTGVPAREPLAENPGVGEPGGLSKTVIGGEVHPRPKRDTTTLGRQGKTAARAG